MKVLLINPPINTFDSIYASSPVLLGQLKVNGIDANILDLNIEFLKEITSSKYLRNTEALLEKIYKNNDYLNDGVNEKYKINKDQFEQLNRRIEKYIVSNKKIINIYSNSEKNFYEEYILAKTLGKFEDKDELNKYIKIFHTLASFSFLPFYPEKPSTKISAYTPIIATKNDLYKFSYEDITDKCSNKKRNIYIDFFDKEIDELNLNQYDIIGITIPFEQNLIASLTLGKLLKERTNVKVVIGGVVPTTTIDGYINHPDMFGKYFDHILIGDGEKSIVEYVKYLEGKIPISEVSGLVYKNDNKIIRNKEQRIQNIKEIYQPSYDGINFNDYVLNNYIALEFSKGCYWHKCIFCYNHLWKKYYIMNAKDAVDIIENLSKKYNITLFNIMDDALNINFAEKFADEIIKRKLQINYVCFFRAEETLTYDILKKLKLSGLCQCFFGIESGSERILNLMNKGINLKTAERIFKDCYEIGIDIDVGLIYGFPTENKDDLEKTIKFAERNKKYISNTHNFIFHLTKSSAMLTEENIKKLGITNIKQPEEFSDDIYYENAGLSREEVCKILKERNINYALHTKWI